MTISPDLAKDLREVNERLLVSSLREQEAAETATHEKAQIAALIEVLHEGVIMADASGRMLMLNACARTMLELSTDGAPTVDTLAESDFRRLDGVLLSPEEHPLRRALIGEEFVESEILLVRSDGETRRLLASGRAVTSGAAASAAIVVLRDITERRHLEARLAQTEKLAALGTLSAGMAHEINTPLAYALGNIDFALEALPPIADGVRALGTAANAVGVRLTEVGDALREAREGAQRVRHVVADLKQLGLVDGRDTAVVDLTEILEGALRMTGNYLRHHVVVRRDYRVTPPVRAHAGQLGQVFSNLLMNAAYASSSGGSARSSESGEIVVATFTDELGRAVVEVQDFGPGITDELKRRIFDPFVTTKPVGQGTGLGLSICFSIVESLGGQLSVVSEPGKGATFRVVLSAAEPVPAPAPPVAVSGTPAPARRGRVLVIDDDAAMCRVIQRLLRADHDVTTSVDAKEALARLVRGDFYDVILCDLMMPGMGGQELHEALLAHDADLAKRIVFVTGGAFTPRADAFLESVTNLKLLKPIDAGRLRSIVADHVHRSMAASTPVPAR